MNNRRVNKNYMKSVAEQCMQYLHKERSILRGLSGRSWTLRLAYILVTSEEEYKQVEAELARNNILWATGQRITLVPRLMPAAIQIEIRNLGSLGPLSVVLARWRGGDPGNNLKENIDSHTPQPIGDVTNYVFSPRMDNFE